MPLYPKTRFLLHAFTNENSLVLLLQGHTFIKSQNLANSLIKAWSMQWACSQFDLRALPDGTQESILASILGKT
jgi:hypothetical protein